MWKLNTLLIIPFIALSGFIFAQPANDDCGSATTVTDLDGTCNTYNNSGATLDAAPANLVGTCFTENNTSWFQFTAQGSQLTVDVSSTVNKFNPEIVIFGDTDGDICDGANGFELDCNLVGTGNYGSISASANTLTIGDTYWIMIVSDSEGNYDICVDNPVPPANDDCSSPTVISSLDGTCTTGTTVGAGPDAFAGSCWSNINHTGGGATVWYSFVAQGNTADIDVTGATAGSGPAITIYSSTDICDPGQTAQIDCADGGFTTESINGIYPLVVGDTYYVQVALDDDAPGSFDICIDNPENDPGDNCLAAEPFCTASPSTFDAATNTTVVDAADYGCLATQPNPKWFYLEIDTPGDSIFLQMSNSNSYDIDYALWGPFADVAAGCDPGIDNIAPVDCSYSIADTETASITGASTGDIYIMVITNFEDLATTITLEQTAGTGSTDCTILPVELTTLEVFERDGFNLIRWETASENNNSHFILQNSLDGINWVDVSQVEGKGSVFSNTYYQLMHNNPKSAINYYRLIQVDFDGTRELYGPITADNLNEIDVLKIVNLMGQEVDETYSGVVMVHYANGRTVKRIQ